MEKLKMLEMKLRNKMKTPNRKKRTRHFSVMTKELRPRLNPNSSDHSTARCESPDCLAQMNLNINSYLPTSADCALKSPVEFHRLPSPTLPLFTVFTDCGRGDGDGAGDIELLLGESD